jgi:thiol:disulfide interchange protein DsbD
MRADWTRRDPAITEALRQLGRSGVPVYALYAPGDARRGCSPRFSAAPRSVGLDGLAGPRVHFPPAAAPPPPT